jgi:hypothetical protein
VNLPLEEMSVEDKLQLLEAIWADLSRVPDQVESPAWHTEALDETKRRISIWGGHLLRLAKSEGIDPRSPQMRIEISRTRKTIS